MNVQLTPTPLSSDLSPWRRDRPKRRLARLAFAMAKKWMWLRAISPAAKYAANKKERRRIRLLVALSRLSTSVLFEAARENVQQLDIDYVIKYMSVTDRGHVNEDLANMSRPQLCGLVMSYLTKAMPVTPVLTAKELGLLCHLQGHRPRPGRGTRECACSKFKHYNL